MTAQEPWCHLDHELPLEAYGVAYRKPDETLRINGIMIDGNAQMSLFQKCIDPSLNARVLTFSWKCENAVAGY